MSVLWSDEEALSLLAARLSAPEPRRTNLPALFVGLLPWLCVGGGVVGLVMSLRGMR